MHKGQDYSEKIEAYLRNELSESERAEFEQLLQKDPLLQNELTLQQDIVASICTYRKNELKQRLNRIDVRDTGRGNLGAFTTGGLIVGGLAIVGMAGLFVVKNSGKEVSHTQLSGSVAQVEVLSDSNEQAIEVIGSVKETTSVSNVDIIAANTVKKTDKKAVKAGEEVKKVPVKKEAEIQPVMPSDEISEELLKEQEINAVLQSKSAKDDGSLSVYADKKNIPYINVEAEHGHVEEQARMLKALKDTIEKLRTSE